MAVKESTGIQTHKAGEENIWQFLNAREDCSFGWDESLDYNWKQDAAHEPNAHTYVSGTDVETHDIYICSHAEHFSAIVYLNSLVHISPVTSLQCGLESVECGVWSVK